MTINDCVLAATRHGLKVWQDEDGWWISVPKRPRRPAETLGTYRSEDRAWVGAALVCKDW
jgi:hypothetical protein